MFLLRTGQRAPVTIANVIPQGDTGSSDNLRESFMENVDKSKKNPTKYFVNGEVQETDEKELSVGVILESAEFTPASDYELEDDANQKQYTDPLEIIHIHEDQKFTATFTGVTPTSES